MAMNQLAGELIDQDFESDLKHNKRPLLTIFGVQDNVVQPPHDESGLLQCADENRYYVSLDECGHFPMLQEKAKFNRLLLDFIHADENLIELAPKEYWRRRVR
jgi:pimeloyl-ACP methyl ester carboxylesterase